jgi:hypothetical protein
MKRGILAILILFVFWSLADYLIHSLLLSGTYQATAKLWRPMAEMKMFLIHITVLISAVIFVLIYTLFFKYRGAGTGLAYGFLYGIGAGISMGYGTYAVMPIPYALALSWFLGTLFETTLGGLLLGWIVKKSRGF